MIWHIRLLYTARAELLAAGMPEWALGDSSSHPPNEAGGYQLCKQGKCNSILVVGAMSVVLSHGLVTACPLVS